MRVLIADDERKVCALIQHIINWELLNMEVIGFAYNGESALQMIKDEKPDIVITDIRMPGLNGLEVIRMAKEINPSIEFIVVSGFKQFDYAKEALQYGVSNYLLKPANRKELTYTLNQIKNRSEKKVEKEREVKRISETAERNKKRLRKDILFQILSNQVEEDWKALNGDYFYGFREGCFQLGVIKIDGIPNIQKHSQYFINKLEYLLTTLMTNCHEFEFTLVQGKYVILLNYDPAEEAAVRKNLKLILENLQDQQDIFKGFSVSGSLGNPVGEFVQVFSTLESARVKLNQRLIYGTNRIYYKEVSAFKSVLPEMFNGFREALFNALDIQDTQKVTNLAHDVLRECLQHEVNGDTALGFYREILEAYILTLKRRNLYEADAIPANLFLELENFGSLAEVNAFFLKSLLSILKITIARAEENESRPIIEAKNFIEKNFKEPITLEVVSKEVGFSSSYFSAMFKSKTGETFSEYLFRKRMEEAKNQLRDTRHTIAVICDDIGYSDIKHFAKGFKKFTGLTPKDYRKLHG